MFIEIAQAAGVIDDAPSFSDVLTNVLTFLLQVSGIIGIIGIVIAGILYFVAGGDRRQIALAKTITGASIVGIAILFASFILIKTIQGFFS